MQILEDMLQWQILPLLEPLQEVIVVHCLGLITQRKSIKMLQVPSLVSLCIKSTKDAILDDLPDHVIAKDVCNLPSDLLDQIVAILPPLALQNLQDKMTLVSSGDYVLSDDGLTPLRKRKRYDIFDIRWKALYVSRWVAPQNSSVDTNWQQIYWEKHLQTCLDATWRAFSDTSFDGFLGDIDLPDSVLKYISDEGHASRSKSYSKLISHFERVGQYARCLSLQTVHYVAELDRLLKKCQLLQYLEINLLTSKKQVEGLCKLLEQKKETLLSLEFVGCKLPAHLVTAICESLHVKGLETNVIKTFSITRSCFIDSSYFPFPIGLESLLTAARDLTTLVLSNNHISTKTAKMLFDTLLDVESGLQVLDLSNNNIAGWLSHFNIGFKNSKTSDHQKNKSLKFLRVLNLSGNHLHQYDADCLKYAMSYMPKLEVLNLSGNPLKNDGIRNLIPYLIEKSRREIPLTELYLEKCWISCDGARQLLNVLAACKVPLKYLSIGHNNLSSEFGHSLGRFLSSGIQTLEVSSIGMGSTGFLDARNSISGKLSLVRINLSDNDGKDGITHFLSKLISESLELVSVDASSNLIPLESFPIICSCLKAANGKLEHFNILSNPVCGIPNIDSLLAEFQINGKPEILLSTPPPDEQASRTNT